MDEVPAWYAPPGEPVRQDERMKLWRLTLECGHLRISGPWGEDEPDDFRMIGDITACELCPKVTVPAPHRVEMPLRQIVNVEPIPAMQYREPDDKRARARMDQLSDR